METIEELKQRLIDLERRFFPIEKVLYEKHREEIEVKKSEDIERDGTNYTIRAIIETDKGNTKVEFNVKGYTEKQALYFANEKVIYPQMVRLKDSGKIKWFKTISKEIIK
jgi:hypothetical protein